MVDELPSVTLVIPTYNSSRTIERCLRSVLAQDYPTEKIEVIVTDGGSTDATRAIVTRLGVPVQSNPSRLSDGSSMGRDRAAATARGEVIVFLDSDNVLSSRQWLRDTVRPLVEDSRVGFVNCPVLSSGADVNAYSRYLSKPPPSPAAPYPRGGQKAAHRGNYALVQVSPDYPQMLTNGAAVRKTALAAVGGFDYDWSTGLRLVRAGWLMAWTSAGIRHLRAASLLSDARDNLARMKLVFGNAGHGGLLHISRRPDLVSVYSARSRPEVVARLMAVVKYSLPPGSMLFTAKMIRRDGDRAWLYHPLAALFELLIVGSAAMTYPAARTFVSASIGLGGK